ncbi:MAG: T9SS type A sorting domain-containing protein [Saprospiraceae bacterium]|nr:T9SS type A sorting domain-containing protein [Saprospiraceae bacterium]
MTFSFAANGLPYAENLDIEVVSDDEIFVSTFDGVFKTNDAGSTWQMPIFEPSYLFSYGFAFDRCEDGNIYFANGQTLRRSSDGGNSFTEISPPLEPYQDIDHISSFPNGLLFISASYQMWRSEDYGSTWTEIIGGPSYFTKMEQSPNGYLITTDNGFIQKSFDNGNAWSSTTMPIGAYSGYDFAIGPLGEIYLAGTEYFYWSNDDGNTWDSSLIDVSSGFFLPSKFAVNNVGHIFALSTWDTPIWKSIDGGQSWNQMQAIPNFDAYYSTDMELSPSQRLYLATGGFGIFRSSETTSSLTYASGQVWNDKDLDCQATPSVDQLLPKVFIKAIDQSNHTTYGFSNAQSNYLLPVDVGSYNVEVIPPSPYWASCNTMLNVPASALNTTITGVDARLKAIEQCPYMEVEIGGSFLRRCFPGQYVIKYCNKGTVTADNASITLSLDSFINFVGSSIPNSVVNGQEIQFPVGNVEPGDCGQFTVQVEVSCNASLGQMHCSKVYASPDLLCPEWQGPVIRLSAECIGNEVVVTIKNEGGDMTTPLDWSWAKWLNTNDFETITGNFLLPANCVQTVTIPVNGDDVYFYAEKPSNYPFGDLLMLWVTGCGSTTPNMPVNISSNNFDDEPFLDELCLTNIGSFDPNDKQGFPKGLSDEGYIAREQSLEYVIRFQNTGTDTAFNIVIRDTLSEWLDPASIRLGASSHTCDLELSGENELVFKFNQIMLPDSNINETASHGFVSYTVLQKPNNPDGKKIRNRAGIYFDFNDPVMTNNTLHTIGIPSASGTHETKSKPSLIVSPNPFSNEFKVKLDIASAKGQLIFRILDSTGKILDNGVFTGNELNYRNGKLPNGLYLIEIRTENGSLVGSGKAVKH